MRNDKLSVQSMDFAVSIINLVKSLKEKRESIISNQIGRSGTSIGANIPTSVRHSMLTARRILLLNYRLLSRKQMKPDIGWNCSTKQIIYPKQTIKRLIRLAQAFGLCLFLPSIPQRKMQNEKIFMLSCMYNLDVFFCWLQ